MYRKHFALSAFPFDVTPQPDALFASATLREAEAAGVGPTGGAGPTGGGRSPMAEASQAGKQDRTIRRDYPKVGRNDPCPCGSGKKYKKCHGAADAAEGSR